MKTNRRSVFKKMSLAVAGFMGLNAVKASPNEEIETMTTTAHNVTLDQGVPLFSGSRTFGKLVFIAGKGAHFKGDIAAHTEHVLNELKTELEKAGSSMNKVLKCNVYLNDLKDYKAMNDVYKGKFGDMPPVRTTVAPAGGIPGDSLVEIDCIAYID